MWINLSPLKKYRDFRLLFISQTISFLGNMVSYVAVPYQVYLLTQSSLYVGLLSLAQLIPMLFFSLIGGQIADTKDRRRILIASEAIMGICVLVLMLNALQSQPSIALIFLSTIIMQATNGFHSPALGALLQKVVNAEDYGAIGALGSLRSSAAMILGPALGGILVSQFGVASAYIFDVVSFGLSLALLLRLSPDLRTTEKVVWKISAFFNNIKEAFTYALRRQELLGTYFIDMAAMTFAFPLALFPEMSKDWGGADAAGMLFSAMSVGALLMAVLSGWTHKIKRQGMMVIMAAALWGIAIVGLGFSTYLWLAVFWLVLAGAFDSLSGIFRGVIWNETIPNDLRGRMASLEMISYMSGPLLGNARAGWMAAQQGWHTAISLGGAISFIAVIVCALLLPAFWHYKSTAISSSETM